MSKRTAISHIRTFNFRLIYKLLGSLLMWLSAAMILPCAVSLVCHDGSQFELSISMLLMLAAGLFLHNIAGRGAAYELHEKESFWLTSLMWILIPLLGAMPFALSGSVNNFVDALFESVSGFTTTGSSILTNLDEVPRGVIVWRSMTQWVGGLGLIMFIIAMQRRLHVGGTHLYGAEFSGTIQRKLNPHMTTSVSLMWRVYIAMTIGLLAILLLTGNGFLNAFCITMSAVSSGGFLPSSAGLSDFSTLSLGVLTVFMLFSGINIALLYKLFTGHFADMWHDEELRLYLILYVCGASAISVSMYSAGITLPSAIGRTCFHVASTISTCGLVLPADTSMPTWPLLAAIITLLFIVLGASAGSTGGGLKLKRVMILFRYVQNYLLSMVHPRAVAKVKIDGRVISNEYINKVFAFVFLYMAFAAGGTLLLTAGGQPLASSICLALANLSNLGPTPLIHIADPTFCYAALPTLSKCGLIVLMLVGRIEIFALIAIFSPAYWKR